MIGTQKVTVVIPTLNEAKGVRETLNAIPACVDEIIIVDGDSKDATRDIASAWGQEKSRNVKVILEKRRGYGRAFKTGFEHATGDLIATGDGDGTYPVELLEKIHQYMNEKQLDFVSCSRLPLEDYTSMRKRNLIGNYGMTVIASVLFMHRFDDVLSGMWVFKRSVLKSLDLRSDSWNFSEEIKVRAYHALGNKFGEYRIPYRERLGETKLVPWKVGIQNVGYLVAMRTGSVSLIQKMIKKNG